jgi:hypothetical protein
MTPEEKKLIRDFNRNIEWLKHQSMKNAVWLTAQQLTSRTGWSKEALRRKRDNKEIVFKKASTGGYRYLYEDLPGPTPPVT